MQITLLHVIIFLIALSVIALALYIRYEEEIDDLIKYFKSKRLYKAIHKKHGGIKE